MASIALGVAGAFVGSMFGMPALGYSIGSAIGSSFEKLPDQEGPKLTDLRVSSSAYGQPIRQVFGTARVPVNVLWSTPKMETKNSESAGGKGGPSQDINTYTYSVSLLLGVCKGPITGISRIWASGKLIYDIRASNTSASGASGNIRINVGSETQVSDSYIDAYEGRPRPAYRGLATIMLQDFQLADHGNSVPNFEAEVVTEGTWELAETETFGFGGFCGVLDPLSELLFIGAAEADLSLPRMEVWDPYTGTMLASIPISGYGTWKFKFCCIVDPSLNDNVIPTTAREVWFSNDSDTRTTQIIAFSLDDFTLTRFSTELTQSPYGPGGMCYIPSTNTVWMGRGATVLNSDTSVWSAATMEILTTVSPSPVNIQRVINIPDLDLVFVNSISGVYFYLGSTGAFLGFADYATTDPAPMCYDNINRRIIFISGNTKFVFIDVDTLVVTEGTHSTQSISHIVYDETNRKIITFDGTQDVHIWNETTYALEQTIVVDLTVMSPLSPMWLVDRWIVGIGHQAVSSFARIPRDPLLQSGDVTLAYIVTQISLQSGLTEDDIDVTALTDIVHGYVIDNTMSGKAAIEPLMVGFLFDAVETG